jgi:hypothetical protein
MLLSIVPLNVFIPSISLEEKKLSVVTENTVSSHWGKKAL